MSLGNFLDGRGLIRVRINWACGSLFLQKPCETPYTRVVVFLTSNPGGCGIIMGGFNLHIVRGTETKTD